MNLFALTRNSARRIVKFPLVSDVQNEIEQILDQQHRDFQRLASDFVAFDGKYKPDDGEVLFIDDYDDIDGIFNAIANPLSVPDIVPDSAEFEDIKAVFSGRTVGGDKIAFIQNFDRRKILSTKGFSFFNSDRVYKKVEGIGMTLDIKLSAVLTDKRLEFMSFYAVRQIFDLSQYYKEATDEDLKEFGAKTNVQINTDLLVANTNNWIRRKISLVMQSQILEEIDLQETKLTASKFGITLKTAEVDGKPVLVFPDDQLEMKKILRFLDEDYFHSVLRKVPHVSSSKKPV